MLILTLSTHWEMSIVRLQIFLEIRITGDTCGNDYNVLLRIQTLDYNELLILSQAWAFVTSRNYKALKGESYTVSAIVEPTSYTFKVLQ